MYDEEERRQELIRRRAMRRKRRMREKRRRIRRRRLTLSLIAAALILFGIIRLGVFAFSKLRSQKAEQEPKTQQTDTVEQTEEQNTYSMVIVTTAAGLNVRTGPGTTYPRLTTLSGGTILSTDEEKNNWSQIAEGSYADDWMCSDYVSRLREEDGRATVLKRANLYAGPSETSFQSITQLSKEDIVRLLYSAKVEGTTWYEVQIQEYIGWISADSIQIHEKQ